MSAQHTRGPWQVCEYGGAVVIMPDQITGYDDTLLGICTVYQWPDERSVDRVTANAALIAAAPEMLEALHQYVSDLRYPPTGDSIQRRIERAEAVIAKAMGS